MRHAPGDQPRRRRVVLLRVTLNACACWNCHSNTRQDGTLGERIQTGVYPALRQAVGPNGTVSYLTVTLAVMRHSGDQIRLAKLLGGALRRHARIGWVFRPAKVLNAVPPDAPEATYAPISLERTALGPGVTVRLPNGALFQPWSLSSLFSELLPRRPEKDG